jgi:hypothetical protein
MSFNKPRYHFSIRTSDWAYLQSVDTYNSNTQLLHFLDYLHTVPLKMLYTRIHTPKLPKVQRDLNYGKKSGDYHEQQGRKND